MELPVVWLVATCMDFIWEQRLMGKMARLDQCRGELLAKLMLLRDAKWRHYTTDTVLLNCTVNKCMELPVVWLVATCMGFIWEQRVMGKVARLDQCRAELPAKLMLRRDIK